MRMKIPSISNHIMAFGVIQPKILKTENLIPSLSPRPSIQNKGRMLEQILGR